MQVQPVTPAAALQAGLPPAAAYQASSLVVRLSVKIFNCTPGELPQGLREQLCGWLCATPAGAEGYIRPGCVHLTVQVRLSTERMQPKMSDDANALHSHILAKSHSHCRPLPQS